MNELLARLVDLIVPAVAGGAAGTLASLIAPWSRWGVEVRRHRLDYRRRLIDDGRAMIERCAFSGGDSTGFLGAAAYHALRPHLPNELVKYLESEHLTATVGRQAAALDPDLNRLSVELGRLERDWKLV